MSTFVLVNGRLVKNHCTCQAHYAPRSMKTRLIQREAIIRNLRHLMRKEKLSEQALAKRAGVAQKTINKILNNQSAPTLDTISRLAAAFGLNNWHLIMPNLPDELISSKDLERLYKSYILASQEGREYIVHAAEREAEYRRGK